MKNMPSTRRQFLKQSGTIAAVAAVTSATNLRVHAAENNTIKIALVGCGGRGTGAAVNALSTAGDTKLWAMADVFPQRLEPSYANLAKHFKGKVDCPPERHFIGLDAYKKAIDSLDAGDVVLLTTAPAFRPMHVEYAVEKGVNIFMEKSFAVDGPGVRRILKAGEAAKQKNLKIAGGLMSRHYKPLEEAVEQIHEGLIGDVITSWAYRVHGPVGFTPKSADLTEVGHQIRNYSNYTWLNGSFLLDWLIHNIDVCCWIKNGWPVSAQGQGGRQVRTAADQLFDHYGVEYTFADGTRMFAQGRHMDNCWGFFGDVIHGTKGSAVLGEGISAPKIYKAYKQTAENMIWKYKGPGCDHYQREHDMLFEAIRQDKPYNEAERCAYASLAGILGRMAAESGKEVAWDAALASNVELAPKLDQLTWDGPAPVMPDDQGKYPVAMPGFTKVV